MEARDRVVVDAAWRVIAREGLPGLSVRALAAEAGLPPSSLRTTFPTQAGVRRAAVVEAMLRRQRRLDAARAEGPRALLAALLPLTADDRAETAVLAALRAAAAVDPALGPLQEEADEAALSACEDAVRGLGLDDPLLVQLLHALVDGLALRLLDDPDAGSIALPALDRLLIGARGR